ncbi:hypothetical protein LIER_06420 [Lithospermum erythrorhizon]|uniref:Uncharacterized protein n=1 Tax=Lithospermum erythrorhizon TaxID=34254 RepID=A0AAV3P5J7_LITER
MESKISNKPGVSTRAQSALEGIEDATIPLTQANPPKRPSKAHRMKTSTEARAEDLDPQPSSGQREKYVREKCDIDPVQEGTRQNKSHHTLLLRTSTVIKPGKAHRLIDPVGI